MVFKQKDIKYFFTKNLYINKKRNFMKVKLIAYTPEPEKVCAASAMTSFKLEGSGAHIENLTKEEAHKIIRMVLGYGHHSVIEHANFTFSIEEISRACTHQLVRHRLASYTQQSQRYVKIEDFDPVIPDSIKNNEKAKKIFDEMIDLIPVIYKKLISLGIPPEDARFILPNATKTNITVTMNARELHHFFNLRCCARAQWEIRELATEMLRQVRKVAPVLFEGCGPSCVKLGYCPEGNLKPSSCDITKIREKFERLGYEN